ncbi:MAG: peptidoglycan bridge formation glycyltransferase FemA/FemB family protein [Anaerolineales bacterium]|nr:peptidoglycan bridge formation glycyltransferase FemA/FemB family protein [Anaerolineales bacterium]
MHVSQTKPTDWNERIGSLPGAHVLQTGQWAAVKERFGWQPLYVTWESPTPGKSTLLAAALVMQRTLPVVGFAARMRVLYVPKGPLLDWDDASLRRMVLNDLQKLARRQGGIFIKIDPDVLLGVGIPGSDSAQENPSGQQVAADLTARQWRYSEEQIQFRNTVLIDLTPDEDTLLAQMKQKTRYNIRLAMRKGVSVRPATPADFHLLYLLYAQTSVRDGFTIREETYYQHVWSTFWREPTDAPALSRPEAEALVAEIEGELSAGVVIFRFAGKAWYLYGMSSEAHREKMPNYLLQWEAMRRARAVGCRVYDLWGAPENFNEQDGLWGVYRFKEGLGGSVVRTLGAWDLPTQPLLYRLYTHTLPHLLDLMRRRGQTSTRTSLE